jgi:hypothetical protein
MHTDATTGGATASYRIEMENLFHFSPKIETRLSVQFPGRVS